MIPFKPTHTTSFFVYYVILFGTIALGIFLRFYHLGQQSYWMDEGYTINAVLSITEKGRSVLDSGQPYFCPLYCYPTAWLTKILGENAATYRLMSALVGSLFIIVFWTTVKNIYGKNIALVGTIFVSLSYWQIAWSRQARWYTLLTLATWLSIYFLYQYVHHEKNNNSRIALSLVFLVIAIIVQPIAYLLIPIYTTFLAWSKKSLREILAVLCLATIVYLVSEILSTNKDNNFVMNVLGQIKLNYTLPYYLGFYIRSYWPLIFFGLIALSKKKQNDTGSFYKLGICTFLIYLISISLFTNIIHYRYLFHLTPFLYLSASIGALTILDQIKLTWTKYLVLTMIVTVFFATGHGILQPKSFYSLESDDPSKIKRPYYAYTPQPDFNAVYRFIGQNRQNGDIVISSHPQFNKIFLNEPGYWIQYDYLGISDRPNTVINGKEYYVGAETIASKNALEKIVLSGTHGFIITDFSASSKIDESTMNYIAANLQQVFSKTENAYSKIHVYRF
ncbi:MAG: glycosyltransferase family 39 protein [Patescibacteria group bacterium]|jgi:uncharacterized membrane protein